MARREVSMISMSLLSTHRPCGDSPRGGTRAVRAMSTSFEPAEASGARGGGSSCSVTAPERSFAGSCAAPPDGEDDLACLPDRERRELSGRELERKLDQLEQEIQGT